MPTTCTIRVPLQTDFGVITAALLVRNTILPVIRINTKTCTDDGGGHNSGDGRIASGIGISDLYFMLTCNISMTHNDVTVTF